MRESKEGRLKQINDEMKKKEKLQDLFVSEWKNPMILIIYTQRDRKNRCKKKWFHNLLTFTPWCDSLSIVWRTIKQPKKPMCVSKEGNRSDYQSNDSMMNKRRYTHTHTQRHACAWEEKRYQTFIHSFYLCCLSWLNTKDVKCWPTKMKWEKKIITNQQKNPSRTTLMTWKIISIDNETTLFSDDVRSKQE